jgi:hypothetical protein
MSDDPVRPAASTPEALHAIIADAFSRGDVGAFPAAHEDGASVAVPPGGTCAHGLAEIRSATAPVIALRPRMTSVVYKTLRSNELALTHASWDLDGTAPERGRCGSRTCHLRKDLIRGHGIAPASPGCPIRHPGLPRPAVAARAVPCGFLRVQPAGPGLGSWAPGGELWLVVGWPLRQPSAPASPASGPAAHVPQHS